MSKQDFGPFDYSRQCAAMMSKPGGLLGVIGHDGRSNVMAIGWYHLGILWEKPTCLVYVRPSRHSYTCLEEIRQFTINLGTTDLAHAVNICGTVSGRSKDKCPEAGITTSPGRLVKAPIVNECILHYECNVVHYNDVLPENLHRAKLDHCYPKGDFHRIYFGDIVACYGDKARLEEL